MHRRPAHSAVVPAPFDARTPAKHSDARSTSPVPGWHGDGAATRRAHGGGGSVLGRPRNGTPATRRHASSGIGGGGSDAVGLGGALTSVEALKRQRSLLLQMKQFQSKTSQEWKHLMGVKDLWKLENKFLEERQIELRLLVKEQAKQLDKETRTVANLRERLKRANQLLRTSGNTVTGSYTTIDWSALRWSTSKLLSPGSTYLSIYGWVHCIFTICVFLGLFYAIGIAARSSRFPTLLEWSLSSDRTWTRLWPVTVGNLLHIHMPLVILAVLSVEFVILCRRGQVARRSVYMCALSSFIFYWLLYAWMWFQEDQPDAGESLTSHADTSTSPDSRQLDAVLAAARTATTGVTLMFTGVMRGMSIHQQLLTTPTLWLILLLPPPAFLAVRVLRFPKLGRPVSEGWGQRALSACASACLWAGNAVLICLATVLACHVLSSLSSRPAMLALINWHELPPGASPDFPVHWAVHTRAGLFYYLPVCLTIGIFVLRLALLLAHREHPAAFMQHLAIDAVFLGVVVAWIRVILAIDTPVLDLLTAPTLVCVSVCLGRMLVAFHFNFWRESISPVSDDDDELDFGDYGSGNGFSGQSAASGVAEDSVATE